MFWLILSVVIRSLLWFHRLPELGVLRQADTANSNDLASCRIVSDFTAAARILGKRFTMHTPWAAAPQPQTPRPQSGGAPPRQLPMRADEVAGVAVRIAFQVILVLGLRLPEIAGGRELGHDLARPQPRGLDVGDGVLGNTALFLARV